jgi:hypothetical protein
MRTGSPSAAETGPEETSEPQRRTYYREDRLFDDERVKRYLDSHYHSDPLAGWSAAWFLNQRERTRLPLASLPPY